MLQNPAAGQNALFRKEWLRFQDVRPATLNVYILVDPASSRKRGSDRTAMAVIGIDAAGNKWLMDGYHHRMPLKERWQRLNGLRKVWTSMPGVQIVRVGYEKYGMQSDIEYFEEEMRREKDEWEIVELNWPREGGHAKYDRIQRLEPDFRSGRFLLSAVVQEEVGGAGAIYWAEHLDYPVELVVLGEPSANALALGHRGVVQFWLTFHGRSVHASAPERGANPNYALAAFLMQLEAAVAALPAHPVLGPTSVAPTVIQVDTTSGNVTPAWTRVVLGTGLQLLDDGVTQVLIDRLAGDAPHSLAYASGMAPSALTGSDALISGFYTPPDSPLVARARAAIAAGAGQAPELIRYRFATDGRHFAPRGLPVIGYSPAEEEQAHIAGESISLRMMAESLRGHVALLREF